MDSPEKAYKKSMALVEGVKCQRATMWRTIRCLQELTGPELSAHIWDIPIVFMEFPNVIVSNDPFFFRGIDAFQALREGRFARKDLMMGLNADEGTFWNTYAMSWFSRENAPGPDPPMTNLSTYHKSIQLAFKDHLHLAQLNGVKYTYDLGSCNPRMKAAERAELNYADQVNQMVGDYFFTCDMMWMADELIANGHSAVYFYYFDQRSSTNPWPRWMGVMHGYEIEYVFGAPITNASAYTPAETEFSRVVIDLWSSFARTGIPSSIRVHQRWLPFVDRRQWYFLNESLPLVRNMPEMKETECRFWRSVKDAEYITHEVSSSNRAGLLQASLVTALLHVLRNL